MTTNRTAVAVLADTIGRTHNTYGPHIYEIAEHQLAALEHAGYVVVPRTDMWSIAGWLRRNLPTLAALERKRGIRLLEKLNAILPPSENDDAPPNTHDGPGGKW